MLPLFYLISAHLECSATLPGFPPCCKSNLPVKSCPSVPKEKCSFGSASLPSPLQLSILPHLGFLCLAIFSLSSLVSWPHMCIVTFHLWKNLSAFDLSAVFLPYYFLALLLNLAIGFLGPSSSNSYSQFQWQVAPSPFHPHLSTKINLKEHQHLSFHCIPFLGFFEVFSNLFLSKISPPISFQYWVNSFSHLISNS